MVKKPPEVSIFPLTELVNTNPELWPEYLILHNPLDAKGRYLPFSKLYHRFPSRLDKTLAWSIVRHARDSQQTNAPPFDKALSSFDYYKSPKIVEANFLIENYISCLDLERAAQQLGEDSVFKKAIGSLAMNEAISSSQLEGASTPTKNAIELLWDERTPENISEKMIVGNFKLMQAVWSQRNEPLSLSLIKKLHYIGMVGINDEKYQPGVFRTTDDIEVVNASGEVVHKPPLAKELEHRLEFLVSWLNNSEPNSSASAFVIAAALHFAIGHEHPFHDGNGRLARSLFYWVMFKHEKPLFRYLSISAILKNAQTQYGNSFLYTEGDNMDMTYFIDHQAGVVTRALRQLFQDYSDMRK
jgi:hypothetical protein